jgi:hypothetical protein
MLGRLSSFIFVMLAAAFFFEPIAHGQDQSRAVNSLREGAWALQFGIRNNFTLGSFQGATIAAQYHLSSTHALRAGVFVGGNVGDGTNLGTRLYADTIGSSTSNNNSSNSINVSLTVQYVWYTNPQGAVQFYGGVGPSVYYNHRHDEQEQIRNEIANGYWTKTSATLTNNSWGVGTTGVAGVEWFAAEWFALHAEYAESINYSWSSNESEAKTTWSSPGSARTTDKTTGSGKGWSLNSLGVNFGLSIYF